MFSKEFKDVFWRHSTKRYGIIRVALVGIIVENFDSVEKLNQLLHQHAQYIIGRMGVPHPQKGISIISVAMDAPADVISSLSGKLGMLPGVNTKTVYSRTASGGQKSEG